MAKQKSWEDVRLLSFDLQTVEFAYAKVEESADDDAIENRILRYL